MFQGAASFHLGIVAQLTGYGASLAEIGGSAVEIVSKFSDLWSSDTRDKLIHKLTQDASNNERNISSIVGGATYIRAHFHEIANPLPPIQPVGDEQPITGQNMERQFHESRLLEPAHQAGKLHSDEHWGGELSVQTAMQTTPMELEPAWKDGIEIGWMGTTQNLQQENRLENQLDVLDQTINVLLPIEARFEFQGLPSAPEPEYPELVHTNVVAGVLAVDVDNDDGYDSNGYDCDGYDSNGYDGNGYDNYGSDNYGSDN